MVRSLAVLLSLTIAFLPLMSVLTERSAQADSGDHWCPHQFDWSSKLAIPVVIHPDLDQWIWHQTGTPWTDAEVLHEVLMVLEKMMDQAPSGIPPLYFAGFEPAGTVWDGPNAFGEWGIAIRPKLGIALNDACQSEMVWNVPNTSYGKRVYMATSVICPIRWEHYRFGAPPETFGGTLMHELMHAIGFKHSDVCQSTLPPCTDNPGESNCCGLMAPHAISSEYYEMEYSDWHALTNTYGAWENDGDYRRESPDALSWVTLGAAAIPSGPTWTSTQPGPSSFLPVLATNPTSLHPHFYRWRTSDGAFISVAALTAYPAQLGPMAIAFNGSNYFMWYMRGQSANDVRKNPRYAWADWTTILDQAYPTPYASRHGVGGTWDPKSTRLVHVYRDRENNPRIGTSTVGGNITDVVELTSDGALFTPSVACGSATLDYNCIMVWADDAAGSGEQFHYLKWVFFRVTGSTVELHPTTYSQGYVMYGPPAVVYRGPESSSGAFAVTFKAYGRHFYTMRKSATPSAAWTNAFLHAGPQNTHAGPPLIGATSSGVTEVWVKYNLRD